MNSSLSNTATDPIFLRRAVWPYVQKKISRDTIESLLQVAISTPAALRQEPWRFVVVQDQCLLNEISAIDNPQFDSGKTFTDDADQVLSDSKFNIFHGADALIVIVVRSTEQFVEADCWLAAENMIELQQTWAWKLARLVQQ